LAMTASAFSSSGFSTKNCSCKWISPCSAISGNLRRRNGPPRRRDRSRRARHSGRRSYFLRGEVRRNTVGSRKIGMSSGSCEAAFIIRTMPHDATAVSRGDRRALMRWHRWW
jgi:hypothetical protein